MSFAVSFLNRSLSRDVAWEFSALALFIYLLFHPALSHPLSLAVALGGGLFLFLWRPLGPEIFKRMGAVWFLFLIESFLTSSWSFNPGLGLQSNAFLFLGTALFLMASKSSIEAKARLENAGFLLALAAAGLGLIQVFLGFDQWAAQASSLTGLDARVLNDAEKSRRAFGPLVTSGSLAALLILFIPVGFIQWKIQSGTKKVFFLLATGILLAALLATKSVGAWVSLGFAVGLILLYRKAWGWLLAVGISCLAAVFFILSARGLTHWEIGALAARFSLWLSAWELFKTHIWFGWGAGSFDEAYQQSGRLLARGARFAHNLFAQILVEQGILGLVLFAAALVSFARRLKAPARWEGWGVLTGAAAFFIFSFFDLPFQMPELIWIFALLLGRLELNEAKAFKLPPLPGLWAEWVLLGILLVAGFWPPFRPFNWALLAGAFWTAAAAGGRSFEKIPLWIAAGGLFLILRAFNSASALGTVRFLETAGLALVFILVLGAARDPEKFFKRFCWLGLFWALGLWIDSFQSADMKDWEIFPNPKQAAIFLLPLLFLSTKKPWKWTVFWTAAAAHPLKDLRTKFIYVFTAATLWILKSSSALAGFIAGALCSIRIDGKKRFWVLPAGALLIGVVLFLRTLGFAGPDQGATQWDRLSIWKCAVEVWAQSPFIGVGPGVFAGDFHRFEAPRAEGVSRYQMDAEVAHNEFLDWLTAFGILGFLFAFFVLRHFWPRRSEAGKRAALTALSAASLFDFCFHTPLIVLQAAGLLTPGSKSKASFSWAAGFLAFGLASGLFGAAAWVPSLLRQANSDALYFPKVLQHLDDAARLNAWDARVKAAQADYLEQLYLATGDPVWKSRSDDAFDSVLALEPSDGQWVEQKAERCSARFNRKPDSDSAHDAETAWGRARWASPLNAFVYFDEGLFLEQESRWRGKRAWGDRPTRAMMDFQKAVELEPNYAAAWVNLGTCQKENPATRAEALESFRQALAVYKQWKDADRIDPLEKQMVSLPPAVVLSLQHEVSAP